MKKIERRVAQAEQGLAPKLGVMDKIRELGDHPTKLLPFISSTTDIIGLLKARSRSSVLSAPA